MTPAAAAPDHGHATRGDAVVEPLELGGLSDDPPAQRFARS
jgi:hypothetical protein